MIDEPTLGRQNFPRCPAMLTLLSDFYDESDPARRAELLECCRRNVQLAAFGAVYLFLEDRTTPEAARVLCPELRHPKVTLVPFGRRVTFGEYFGFANRLDGVRRCVLANADIYFDASLGALDDYSLQDRLLCLSRWDVQADGSANLYVNAFSQDAWIFQTPLRLSESACRFTLGIMGCDSRLARVAIKAHLRVSNPSRTIRAHHLHLSGVRHYSRRKRVHGHYHAVPATEL
jgi:hypothetical protein